LVLESVPSAPGRSFQFSKVRVTRISSSLPPESLEKNETSWIDERNRLAVTRS
jgi:hypothetical protein